MLRSVRTIPMTVSITLVWGYIVPSRNDIHLAFGFCYCFEAAEASTSCSMKPFTRIIKIALDWPTSRVEDSLKITARGLVKRQG